VGVKVGSTVGSAVGSAEGSGVGAATVVNVMSTMPEVVAGELSTTSVPTTATTVVPTSKAELDTVEPTSTEVVVQSTTSFPYMFVSVSKSWKLYSALAWSTPLWTVPSLAYVKSSLRNEEHVE